MRPTPCCAPHTPLWRPRSITGWHINQQFKGFKSICGFFSLSKAGWSLFLSWVTAACARGRGGVVAAAMSWGPLWPLARMSYLAFLLHQPLIYLEVSLYTHPVELSAFSQVISCFLC